MNHKTASSSSQLECSTRNELMKRCRKIVVKAGTRLLTEPESLGFLIRGIDAMRRQNCQVMLVSSGAVGTGMRCLNLPRRPKTLSEVQALAAIGQGKLMAQYDAECRKYHFNTAQLLLTAADLRSRERYLNVSNCISALWQHQVLPIINENDSVSIDELKFGDNDTLAGLLGTMTGADLTIILTTEKGLCARNEDGSLGERLSEVSRITQEIWDSAGDTDNAQFSIGGMRSKLKAATMVTESGGYLWIADGRQPEILEQILRGEDVGTLFLPKNHRMQSRKCWIKFFSKCSGSILVDDGAAVAVRDHGKSLLPSGVTAVAGSFKRGDTVEIRTMKNELVGRGLVNYDALECLSLIGKHKDEVAAILGHDAEEEIIHRDKLVTEDA